MSGGKSTKAANRLIGESELRGKTGFRSDYTKLEWAGRYKVYSIPSSILARHTTLLKAH